MSTCRFCKKDADGPDAIKYEVRHHAHARCYLKAKGPEGVERLPFYSVLNNLNVSQMHGLGLTLDKHKALLKRVGRVHGYGFGMKTACGRQGPVTNEQGRIKCPYCKATKVTS